VLACATAVDAQDPPAPCAGRAILACVPSPAVPIPANGAIAIAAPPGEQVTVNVYDELGSVVPGSLVLIANGMWAWHATVQPAPGTYEVEVIDNTGVGQGNTIEVVPATERAWPELTSAASLSQVTANEVPACCTLDTGTGVIDFNCMTLTERTYAVLHPGLSSASSPAELNQYLFRYTAPEHSSEVVVLPWTTAAALRLYEMSDEYCYEVAAIDLVTGVIHPYPDLSARCAPHGDLAPIESTVKQLADDALRSPICPMPPDGFAERWCELNAEACEVAAPPRHCHFYPFTCQNQPYPGPGWRSISSAPREPLDGLIDRIGQINEQASADDDADGGTQESAGDSGVPDPAAEGSVSCTILRQHTQASLSHLIVGFAAACAWRGQRRRNR
jgi:hypothetical protein